jgi:hypothetical protein
MGMIINTRFALITSDRVYVYEGNKQIAYFDIEDEVTAEDVEEVRLADYSRIEL